MGHVHVEAKIKGTRTARVTFLVDTGATYALISPELARQVGIKASQIRQRVRLANGKVVQFPVALGLVQIGDREAPATFWIGPCDEPLLGVETLEGLGLAVDPGKGCLRATRAWASRLGAVMRLRPATPRGRASGVASRRASTCS